VEANLDFTAHDQSLLHYSGPESIVSVIQQNAFATYIAVDRWIRTLL